jgi:predicted site-specific integrase-resolvase
MEVETLARNIGIGRTTLWRWTRAGLVPAPERRGRKSLYSPAAVVAARSLAEASL